MRNLNDIPEIRRANAMLVRVNDSVDTVNRLNDKYFNDKDYKLEIVGGFVEGCQYDIQLTSDNYAFGIYSCKEEDVPLMVDKVRRLLEVKALWTFMRDNISRNGTVAGYQNFMKMTIGDR